MSIKVIITGATGMVGEGVLLGCLAHPEVSQVLIVNRRASGFKHPKLKECIAPDFMNLEKVTDQLKSYDACFYCAGVSSVGMKEAGYMHVTYEITMHFAETLAGLNPGMVFTYVSGAFTDSSEKGRSMWARVKGKTENALMRLPFKKVYNFRPAFIKPATGQTNIPGFYKYISWLFPVFHTFLPNRVCTMSDIGQAMINCVLKGYSRQILEVRDIKLLAQG